MRTPRPLFPGFGALIEGDAHDRRLEALERERIEPLLVRHGVLLLRGFEVGLERFEGFTRRFSQRFVVHGASVRARVTTSETTQGVTVGEMPITLHRELHFCPFSPDTLWFYCARAPAREGQTTVGDGKAIVEALGERTRAVLVERRIRYWNKWSRSSWESYFGQISTVELMRLIPRLGMVGTLDDADALTFEYATDAIYRSRGGVEVFANSIDVHREYARDVAAFQINGDGDVRHRVSLADGTALDPAVVAEISDVTQAHTHEVAWEDGDVLMIDNTRVMHGRRAVPPGLPREIVLRMAFCEGGSSRAELPTRAL